MSKHDDLIKQIWKSINQQVDQALKDSSWVVDLESGISVSIEFNDDRGKTTFTRTVEH